MTIDMNSVQRELQFYNNYDYVIYQLYSRHVLGDPTFMHKIIEGTGKRPTTAEIIKAKKWHAEWFKKEEEQRAIKYAAKQSIQK